MDTNRMIIPLLLGLLVLASAGSLSAEGKPWVCNDCNWLATGVVTTTSDKGFSFLAKNGNTYHVRSGGAEIVSDQPDGRSCIIVGDAVRVFGKASDKETIWAARIRILCGECVDIVGAGPVTTQRPEVKIIVERPQPQAAVAPAEAAAQTNWDNRGLITEIDSTGNYIKIRTSAGQFTVSLAGATLTDGTRAIGLGRLNIGDAVRVLGYCNNSYIVNASRVCVTLPRWQADSALPQLPISVAGMIQSVDHASGTFQMTMHGSVVNVMVDKDTYVQDEKRRASFAELKPGMRVKMTGYGTLATGYAAQHIQVISISP